MAPVKMIAIDLDDTLLHDDISLSDYTKDILRKVMERNIRIVIATAVCFRPPAHGACHWSWRCAAYLLYGSVCGALRKRQSAPQCDNGYGNGTGHYRYGYERGWYMHAYIDDEVYVPFRDERTESYEKQCGVSAHVLGEDFWTLAKEPTKLLVFDRDPQVMAEVERVLSEKFSYATNQVKSKPEFLK